ncbi:MAG: PstS family phosphate ABC transporter substrate-binding protein [Spirochaetes bacterium]|nr:PstS family phosphate ABC transporter substrate-binding protein [Spirochaetota bacterium]
MIQKIIYALCSIIIIGLSVSGCGKKNGKEIEIRGSRTMEPALASLAESYSKNHGAAIKIISTGSLKGLTSLSDGTCDMASSSVKMPAQMVWEAQKKGVIVKEFIIAYDIIVPIVHPSNQIKNLFQGQLADMYSGLIKDWKVIEIKPGRIIVVERDDNSGTKLLMNERFFELKKPMETSVKVKSDVDVVNYIARHPSAVGYVSKRFLTTGVKAVNINGFSGTVENAEKKYYPLSRELYLYANEKVYAGDVKSFIDFCTSKTGQDMMKKAGFIPVDLINKQVK